MEDLQPGDRRPKNDRQPGDRQPERRLLERPPGERYAPVAKTPAPPSVARAAAAGALSAATLALAWGLAEGELGLDIGLLVLAAFGGWLVGASVRWGAWRGRDRRRVTGLRALAATLAILVWPVAQAAAWVATRATLPESSLDLAGRLASTPYLTFVGDTVGPAALAEVFLLGLIAWLAAG